MVTAQERFRVVVRERVAPALRSMGMRGSGQTFTLPSETCWAQLGIQRSAFSDREQILFTANLSVVNRVVWARSVAERPNLGAKPTPNTFSMSPERFQERIGRTAGGGDYWWRLSADGHDEDATCDHFLTTIEAYGVPALKREVRSRS
ncbi:MULTISPECIES: DUF4304 domain-containing protein [unclassified Isoptericola]|uniref:DUF4304 domain-containing protein n=1 Tax=unclassified Isoptericola TaxID=2623355 RepID=UPI002714159C|nr:MULTISPECIES: DUF4304 domain-containing protein [unclassified Isoptericola]MDO8145640.1 DUF4304 domain-containing protein [Isoptericola sp. 178]MDO8152117.1 DUF4304 domain-containing protein [Isoptericola sp. b408]